MAIFDAQTEIITDSTQSLLLLDDGYCFCSIQQKDYLHFCQPLTQKQINALLY